MRLLALAAVWLWAACAAHAEPMPVGVLPLDNGAVAYIPAGLPPSPPMVVLLHGAGQGGDAMIARFRADADRLGLVLLAPKARGVTWDVVARAEMASAMGPTALGSVYRYSGSPDSERVAAALAALAARIPTDPARRVLLGFSDGASFALAYGTARKAPFAAVIAVAPGLATVTTVPARRRPVMVLHARADPVLAFGFTADTIVPALREAGLAARLQVTSGGHEIPPEADSALAEATKPAAP